MSKLLWEVQFGNNLILSSVGEDSGADDRELPFVDSPSREGSILQHPTKIHTNEPFHVRSHYITLHVHGQKTRCSKLASHKDSVAGVAVARVLIKSPRHLRNCSRLFDNDDEIAKTEDDRDTESPAPEAFEPLRLASARGNCVTRGDGASSPRFRELGSDQCIHVERNMD